MVFLLEGLAGLGVAFLLAVALAEWAKFRTKAERGFNWIALAGVWFLFAGSMAVATTLGGYVGAGTAGGIAAIFEIVGWIFALIGTLFAAYEVLVEK
jgi:hypothetical protein